MKQNIVWIAAALLTALLTLPATAPAQAKGEVALRTAIETETVKGDLNRAIEQYKKLAKGSDRSIAARALVRMAGCYQKLGNAEARKVYERIVKDFADQTGAVAIARAQLGNPSTGEIKTTRLLWTGREVDFSGSVSSDGRYLSFENNEGGGNLAVHDLTTGMDRLLTHSTDGNFEIGYSSKFSPDGKQIAYSWSDYTERKNRGELRVSGLNDGPTAMPRTLYSGPDVEYIGPTGWSADGKWISVNIDKGGMAIGVVSTTDGTLRVLKSALGPMRVAEAPGSAFFSPDGKFLAVALRNGPGPEHDIFLLPLDGKPGIPLIISPEDNIVMGWTPGGKLLFTKDQGSVSLWALTVADGKAQGAPIRVNSDMGTFPLGMTSSGALYYGSMTGGTDLYTAAIDFGAEKLLTPGTTPLARGASQPDWSPDGKYLVSVVDGNLNIRSVETGRIQLIRGWIGQNPQWSPDGRYFLVQKRTSNSTSGIYQVDVRTGAETPIVTDDRGPAELINSAAWSPDQKKIYYRRATGVTPARGAVAQGRGAAPQGNQHVAFIERDLATGAEREVISGAILANINLSPDGRYIATGSDGAGVNVKRIVLIPVAGGEPRELLRTTAPETNGVLMWAPDSRSFFLRRNPSGSAANQPLAGTRTGPGSEIWRVPIDGSVPRKVDMNVDLDNLAGAMRVHPNGRLVAYAVDQGPRTKELWVLENFLSTLGSSK